MKSLYFGSSDQGGTQTHNADALVENIAASFSLAKNIKTTTINSNNTIIRSIIHRKGCMLKIGWALTSLEFFIFMSR